MIDKSPPILSMGDETALFHLPEHCGNSRIGEPTLGKGSMDGCHRSRTACPQLLKNPQLQISDPDGIRFALHNYRCNTTVVVVSQRKFSLHQPNAATRSEAAPGFGDLARKARSFRPGSSLIGWLYTSTRYAAAQVRRTENRRSNREQECHVSKPALAP